MKSEKPESSEGTVVLKHCIYCIMSCGKLCTNKDIIRNWTYNRLDARENETAPYLGLENQQKEENKNKKPGKHNNTILIIYR